MLSPEQQIDALRPSIGIARNFHHWLVAFAAALLILSIVLWHPIPLMFAALFGVVGLAERQAGPNLEAAIKTYDTCLPTNGEVFISIDASGDTASFYAQIKEHDHPDWQYEFIPQHWKPIAGNYHAKIWRRHAQSAPVMASVEDGILIPRYNPTRCVPK